MKKVICFILLGMLSGIASPKGFAEGRKPNIIFVMIDDLGAEQIGCYGSQTDETPHIDELATKGMLFDNAFASMAD